MSEITLHTIKSIKNEAQKVSKIEPAYSKELDRISKRRFKVRDFHEVNAICKKNTIKYFKANEGISTCDYCRFTYVTKNGLDTKKHNKIHLMCEKENFKLINNTTSMVDLSKNNIGDFGVPIGLSRVVSGWPDSDSCNLDVSELSSFRQTVFRHVRGLKTKHGKCAGIRLYPKNDSRIIDLNFESLNAEHERIINVLKSGGITEIDGRNLNGDATPLIEGSLSMN